jgi:hypothetical protein
LFFPPTYNPSSTPPKSPYISIVGILLLISLFHKSHKVCIPPTKVGPYIMFPQIPIYKSLVPIGKLTQWLHILHKLETICKSTTSNYLFTKKPIGLANLEKSTLSYITMDGVNKISPIGTFIVFFKKIAHNEYKF